VKSRATTAALCFLRDSKDPGVSCSVPRLALQLLQVLGNSKSLRPQRQWGLSLVHKLRCTLGHIVPWNCGMRRCGETACRHCKASPVGQYLVWGFCYVWILVPAQAPQSHRSRSATFTDRPGFDFPRILESIPPKTVFVLSHSQNPWSDAFGFFIFSFIFL
jgi:hypothetical protein